MDRRVLLKINVMEKSCDVPKVWVFVELFRISFHRRRYHLGMVALVLVLYVALEKSLRFFFGRKGHIYRIASLAIVYRSLILPFQKGALLLAGGILKSSVTSECATSFKKGGIKQLLHLALRLDRRDVGLGEL